MYKKKNEMFFLPAKKEKLFMYNKMTLQVLLWSIKKHNCTLEVFQLSASFYFQKEFSDRIVTSNLILVVAT